MAEVATMIVQLHLSAVEISQLIEKEKRARRRRHGTSELPRKNIYGR